MWSFPTLEPVIVEHGSFVVERLLDRPGRVEVGIGDRATPETIVARFDKAEKPITLFVASELGVAKDKIQRNLAKPVGSTFHAGEVVARARHGLRTASIAAPMAGTLTSVDTTAGTAQFIVSSASGELRALVHGEVERIVPDRGALIRASGSRVFGILGFGCEAVGKLVVGLDRSDRELTADQVKDSWRGCVVLTGMTVGAPALQKLKQAGVAGVIVGSISEADIRRFLPSEQTGSELGAAAFWQTGYPGAPFSAVGQAQSPFVIVVTEGFGRIPMAEPVFNFLRAHADQTVSLRAATAVDEGLSRPEVFLTSDQPAGDDPGRVSNDLTTGRAVRVVSSGLGSTATVLDEPGERSWPDGRRDTVVRVQRAGGPEQVVATANVEVLA